MKYTALLLSISTLFASQEALIEKMNAFYPHTKEEVAYIQSFPTSDYTASAVPSQGKFYIDLPKDCIKRRLAIHHPWEGWMERHYARYIKKGSTVLDLGAHIGTHSMSFSRLVGEEGLVISFEAQSKIHRELFHNILLNKRTNVIPIHLAIGDEKCLVHFDKPIKNNEGAQSLTKTGGRGSIQMVPLDSFEFENVSLIKIDVENFEKEVLDGAQKTLEQHHPVVLIELVGHLEKAKRLGWNIEKEREKLAERMKQFGYIQMFKRSAEYMFVWDAKGGT